MASAAAERAARLESLPFESIGGDRRGIVGFAGSVAEIFGRRDLLGLLIGRQLKSRYKNSSLGFLWSLIRPLTMLVIYYVAIGQFLGAARSIPEFAIFVFTGLTIWGLYSEIITTGTTSIVENAGLIKKVYLPREIFPLASGGSAFVNFLFQFAILVVAVIALQEVPLNWNLLYIPAAIAITVVYGIAFAVLLSAVNVYLRDVQYLVEVGLLIFFWASPIVYSWSFVVDAAERLGMAWLEFVYLLNPMSNLVIAFQKGVWLAGSEERLVGVDAAGAEIVADPQPWPADLDLRLAIIAVVGLVLLAIAQRVFARLQGNFAQEI